MFRRWPTLLIALALASPNLASRSLAQTGDFGRPKPSLLEGLIPHQFWKAPVTGYSSSRRASSSALIAEISPSTACTCSPRPSRARTAATNSPGT